MGAGERRIEPDGTLVHRNFLAEVASAPLVGSFLAPQVEVVGVHALGRLPLCSPQPVHLDTNGQDGHDRSGDLLLDSKDVLQITIEALGPNMCVGLRVN